MQFFNTKIPGVIEIVPQFISDSRGYFFESYRHSRFTENGIPEHFVQENQSWSKQGTLRGLHLQAYPYGQSKLVTCLHGQIFDVAVDVRPDSATFGAWVGVELSSKKSNSLYIPIGFAHGFYVLSESATVSYQCGGYYHRESERSVRWNDPTLNIDWPISPTIPTILSDKDQNAPLISKDLYKST